MNAQQVISACRSRKWSAEHIVLRSGYGVARLAEYFDLDTSKSRSELKRLIVDCINELVNTSQQPPGRISERSGGFLPSGIGGILKNQNDVLKTA